MLESLLGSSCSRKIIVVTLFLSLSLLFLLLYPVFKVPASVPRRFLLLRSFLRYNLMVGSNGLEPSTSRLSGVRSNHLSYEPVSLKPILSRDFASPTPFGAGGDEQIRTVDPLLARQVLSQLSYTPVPLLRHS